MGRRLDTWKDQENCHTKNIQLRVMAGSSSGLAVMLILFLYHKEIGLIKHTIYNCKTRRPTNDPQVVFVADGWFYVRVVLRAGHTLQVPIVEQSD